MQHMFIVSARLFLLNLIRNNIFFLQYREYQGSKVVGIFCYSACFLFKVLVYDSNYFEYDSNQEEIHFSYCSSENTILGVIQNNGVTKGFTVEHL